VPLRRLHGFIFLGGYKDAGVEGVGPAFSAQLWPDQDDVSEPVKGTDVAEELNLHLLVGSHPDDPKIGEGHDLDRRTALRVGGETHKNGGRDRLSDFV
jgi:hypothetical protein